MRGDVSEFSRWGGGGSMWINNFDGVGWGEKVLS